MINFSRILDMEVSNEIKRKFFQNCLLPALNAAITLAVFKCWGNTPNLNSHLKYTEKIGANSSQPNFKKNDEMLSDRMFQFQFFILSVLYENITIKHSMINKAIKYNNVL